jgi:N6-L-threonylcarbamoyladenine synthase
VNVLGIETSCDETAASVVGADGVLSDVVWSQVVHAAYGGVVPELASRAHAEQIVPVVRAALDGAGVGRPDAVAATAGPGLVGSVLVGLSFGKAAAAAWGVPFRAVNHLEAHLLSALLEDPAPAFPFLALVVSGGHTTLYLAHAVGRYDTLAETVDDAVGEAYDKVARMLGLAASGTLTVDLPRPRATGLDWSFSGLKTAVRRHLDLHPDTPPADLAASFQEAVTEVLLDRCRRAAAATGVRRLAIGGGVAANGRLRERLLASDLDVTLPPRSRCTDNASMIASAGRLLLLADGPSRLDVSARPRWAVGTP